MGPSRFKSHGSRVKIKINKVYLTCIGIYLFHLSICHFYLPAVKVINFFPFYDWNLFSYNPTYQIWPIIRVLKIENKAVPEPGLIYHSGLLKKAQGPWLVPEQMKRLVARLVDYGPKDELAILYRKELEYNIFQDKKDVEYEIFNGLINVREYFHKQTILEEHEKWKFEIPAGQK